MIYMGKTFQFARLYHIAQPSGDHKFEQMGQWKGQWGQWQVQSPANCFNQKQRVIIPETSFFSIDLQWQKPLTPNKNPLPKQQTKQQTARNHQFSAVKSRQKGKRLRRKPQVSP
jgi:hypothetical protein